MASAVLVASLSACAMGVAPPEPDASSRADVVRPGADASTADRTVTPGDDVQGTDAPVAPMDTPAPLPDVPTASDVPMPRPDVPAPVDTGCAPGSTMACATPCGSTGSARCSGGTFGACTPPVESCNNRDDDCDGNVDNGFACRTGASESCMTSCGSTGTRDCAACAWGACRAPAETCNGRDDNCDGATDEGFRAGSVGASYASDLAPRNPWCDGFTQRWGGECSRAVHAFCAARGCSNSGFGPVENAGDGAEVTCVVGDVRATTFSNLGTFHGPCASIASQGPDCNAAIHRYCTSLGAPSGFGPVASSGDAVTVVCTRNATVVGTTYTTLATHHAVCDGFTQRMGPDCNAAISRFCRAAGHTSGFGPIENSDDTAYVACVDP